MSTDQVPAGAAGVVLSEAESAAIRRGVPNPGIPVPRVSLPTALLFVATLGLWFLATWLVVQGVSAWVTIPLHAAVTFLMFTVLHESTHHAAGRLSWVNEVLGRLSLLFVAGFASFPAIRHIHIEHHRHTNEHRSIDPDAWTSHAPAWQLPLRWLTIDLYYIYFWLSRIRQRPRAEVVETLSFAALVIGIIVAASASGLIWPLALVYLIPQRIGVAVLAWWFDWLPHHGLTETQSTDRYRATRNRVGLEWLLTPVLLYQNYHLVHHLHPSIPFYRYIKAWRRNEDAYLERSAAVTTAWGRELTPGEYRAWRKLTASFATEEAADPRRDAIRHLRVAEVRPLTDDAVSISFDVPESLRAEFRFTAGQHLVLHVDVDGTVHRRTYSICAAATSDLVRIAVRRVPGGVVSTFLTQRLREGDRLGVEAPVGHFTLEPEPTRRRHYVGVAAGSGITPIISMLSTALLVEEHSRFTLIYGNRAPETTMFSDDLRMLERQFEGRLRIVHHFDGLTAEQVAALASAEAGTEDARVGTSTLRAGRIDPERIGELVGDASSVDGWYLCGPQPLVQAIRERLPAHGVALGDVHLELFDPVRAEPKHAARDTPAAVTATVRGRSASFDVDGRQTILDGALTAGVDAPYACMGGACGTCRAKLVAGSVDMEQNLVLTEADLAQGYILTCQSYPTTDRVDLAYDA